MKKTTKLLSLVITAVVLLSACIIPTCAADPKFYNDLDKDAWYYDSVCRAIDFGFMTGIGWNNFRPDDLLTREQFVTVLERVNGMIYETEVSRNAKTNFTDVAAGKWYTEGVVWAESMGITEGVSDGEFGLGKAVTREETATFIARYIKSSPDLSFTEASDPAEAFTDAAEISTWAVDAVEAVRTLGIFMGDEHGRFDPKKEITRAEAAAVIVRLYECLDLDLTAVFDPDTVGEISFEMVTVKTDADGNEIYTEYPGGKTPVTETNNYVITDKEKLSAVLRDLSDDEPQGFEYGTHLGTYYGGSGPIDSTMVLKDKNGDELYRLNFYHWNEESTKVSLRNYKSYTYEYSYLEEVFNLITANADSVK